MKLILVGFIVGITTIQAWGFQQTSEGFPLPVAMAQPAEAKPLKIRLMTFNLWHEGTKVQGGFDKIVDVILSSKADIITLSEIRNFGGKDSHQRLVKALAKKGEIFYGKRTGSDVGVLSRWPIQKAEQVNDNPRGRPGSIVAYHLKLPNKKKLVVCSAHLDYTHYAVYLPRGYDGNTYKIIDKNKDGVPDPVTDKRKLHQLDQDSYRDECIKSFVLFAKKMKRKNIPVILAGDFNECSHLDWTKETAQLYSHNGVVIRWKNSLRLKAAGFVDSWRHLFPNPATHPGATWPSEAWKSGSTSCAPKVDERDRIDFIYYRGPQLRAKDGWIVGSAKYWVFNKLTKPKSSCQFALQDIPWPSDHKGYMVDFEWKSK